MSGLFISLLYTSYFLVCHSLHLDLFYIYMSWPLTYPFNFLLHLLHSFTLLSFFACDSYHWCLHRSLVTYHSSFLGSDIDWVCLCIICHNGKNRLVEKSSALSIMIENFSKLYFVSQRLSLQQFLLLVWARFISIKHFLFVYFIFIFKTLFISSPHPNLYYIYHY